MRSVLKTARRQLTLWTHRIFALPVLVLMPHSRCNCRCVMCDIWKANQLRREISAEELARHLPAIRALGVEWVVLSGGEALMHSNLWAFCALLKSIPVRLTLLSTGLLLERHAADIVRWCDEVIVSLDGSREVHDGIRNVPRAFDRLEAGVAALHRLDPDFRVTGRCVLQRQNFRDLPRIIDAARGLGLAQISFLAADVSTDAFGRLAPPDPGRASDLAPGPDEAADFERVVEDVIVRYAGDFDAGFIAEGPDKLRRLPRYYAALHGAAELPEVRCNAPWVSAVVEADGTVRPCFFHRTLGNVHERPLDAILNSEEAVAFRRGLDVETDSICRKCVCSLELGVRAVVGGRARG